MPARTLRRLEPAFIAVGFALALFVGCSNDSASTAGVTHPTMIEIAPEQFRGAVPCAANGSEAGLKRYVATLIDPNDDGSGGAGGAAPDEQAAGALNADDFALPSSEPTSCLAGVGFGFIVPGRRYIARIQGFDREDLSSRAPGSSLVVDAEGNPVAPRWTAECDATIAVEETIVRAKRCTSFVAADPAAPGSMHVRFASLLGDLKCGDGPGEVATVTVTPTNAEGDSKTAACEDGELVLDFDSNQSVTAKIEAFSAGSVEPLAGSKCTARILPEANVVAECAALSQDGLLRIDLPGALELLGLECAEVTDVRVQALGSDDAKSFPPPSCQQTVSEGFAAGAATVTVTVVHGDEVSELLCSGQVPPGDFAEADCQVQ